MKTDRHETLGLGKYHLEARLGFKDRVLYIYIYNMCIYIYVYIFVDEYINIYIYVYSVV